MGTIRRGHPARYRYRDVDPLRALALALIAFGACDRQAVNDDVEQPSRASTETARLLAPGVVSTDSADELQPSMGSDGRVLYFSRRMPDGQFALVVARRQADGVWGAPEPLPFSGDHPDQEPFISSDGLRLYFTSSRPAPGSDEPNRGRIPWIVERAENGDRWGEPQRVDPGLTLPRPDDPDLSRFWGQPRGPVEHPDGSLYFWAERPDGRGHTDLYRAAPDDSGFSAPVNLGAPINSARYETSAAFAPDGSWIIFGRDEAEDGYGLGDLYVAERTAGGWGEPRNLGPLVNSAGFDASPSVTSDGQLLFSSNRERDGNQDGRHDIYVIQLERLGLD